MVDRSDHLDLSHLPPRLYLPRAGIHKENTKNFLVHILLLEYQNIELLESKTHQLDSMKSALF